MSALPFEAFGAASFAVALALGLLASILLQRPNSRKLPPGPKGYPIIGNLFDFPAKEDPLPWTAHLKKYGSISSVTVLGKNVILFNDLKTCSDVLDKRSALYAGRPFFEFASGLVGWDQQMIMAQPGDHFQKMRTLLKAHISSPAAAAAFHSIQELETRRFILRVHQKPETLIPQIRVAAGSISLRISHGYQVELEKDDPLISLVDNAAKDFFLATNPGAWFVDMFPWMKHLPNWIHFKKVAAEFRKRNFAQSERPHEFVKKEMLIGTAEPSFTSFVLSESPDPATEYAAKFASTAIYGGGSHPVAGALSAFALLMIIHPGCQERARNELDSVIGTKRLPQVSDRVQLPYIGAVIKEVLRWHCVGRIGIPHRAIEDDEYNGYLIPKDAIILPHMWNITRDPKLYRSPDEFNPDRFMGQQPELDPSTYLFGFGRRACPGKDLAHSHLFITVAMILAVYELGKAKNGHGREIEPVCEFLAGTVSYPRTYEYILRVRSPQALSLIESIADEPPPRPSDGHKL